MGFRKYQSVEKANIVSREGHEKIASALQKTGKTSVQDMTSEEKKASGVDRAK